MRRADVHRIERSHGSYTCQMGDGRIVYSTSVGRVCGGCGWPAADCKCSGKQGGKDKVPGRVIAKLRLEKKGRGGKTVTVVYDLPDNSEFLKGLAQELKRACGTGGAVAENTIELQGDLRERVREYLGKKGFGVKG
jgi:translation initiation factor 1